MKIFNFLLEHWEFFITLLPFTYLYKKNNKYKNIIEEFKKKLPPTNKKAKKLTHKERKNNILLSETDKHINVLNLSTHQISIPPNEIDIFYNELENFNYWFVFFHNHYKSITKNLKRFDPKSENGNFDIIVIQEILDDITLGFWEILWYKLSIKGKYFKYKVKFKKFMYKKTKNPKWLK